MEMSHFDKNSLKNLVCQQWRATAKIVWTTKRKIIAKTHVFNAILTTKPIGASIVGLGLLKRLRNLELNAQQIKIIDHETVHLISNYCPNLKNLFLDSIDLNDNQMLRIAKNCTQISLFALHLNYVITDEALVNSIFANCPHLIQLTLKGCCELRGTFLAHLPLNVEYLFWNLIYLTYEYCDSSFEIPNKGLRHLEIATYAIPKVAKCLILQSKILAKLDLRVDFKFYNESLADCIRIKPGLLDSLVELSCDQTRNDTGELIIEDHQLLRMLLEKAKRLRKLCIHHKINNADAALENGLIINAPLEKLKLVGVSDRSLEIIFKLKSLKSLSFERCEEITNDGACRAVNELRNLEELSVKHCPKIENSLLKAALATGRSFRVYCKNTNVQIDEFVKEFPDTVKHCSEKCEMTYCCRNGCEYKSLNVTFWI